ncbi:D-glycerate dehydrogenase [Robbsia sp. Bb-Pol-6]|uniref:D-glycerate dehydrogenase n=1 Tax=Robbsia betulipollinis TaxID=2981849 RepID=A0ABT3ZQS8_9BURK|nr:D-glycerate dehydrogenase [Robbsia betulipollinis]MCY0388575.1 D-glycerate dehydrogenase [Robbsia betulipollinis]
MKQKILVTRALFPDVVDRLRTHFDVETNDLGRVFTATELTERIADKAGLMVMGDPISRAMIAAAPALKAVCNMAVGYNNFDLAALNARGILATNTPDVLNETTADFGWALLMATARRVTEAEHYLRAGKWQAWQYDMLTGTDVFGSTLGIIGMGRIGQAVARRAQGFGMRVVYHNRSRVAPDIERALNAEWVEKDALLRQADHIVLVVPYAPASHHTIGAREIGLMKPTANLINIARGGIVDDAALIEALAAGRIAGAGLDVFEGEPQLNPGFLSLTNVVLAPHIASASVPTRRAMANLAADNLIAALGEGPRAGNPPNVVNPEARGIP